MNQYDNSEFFTAYAQISWSQYSLRGHCIHMSNHPVGVPCQHTGGVPQGQTSIGFHYLHLRFTLGLHS